MCMDPAHGLTIRSTGRACLIRIADFRSSTEAVFAPILRLATTVPKEDFATTLRLPRADFGATSRLPIRVIADSAATLRLILVTAASEVTILLRTLVAMLDFAATRPILVTADFATTPQPHRLGNSLAIARLHRALPAARTEAPSVAWRVAHPHECIATMDIPVSARPGALLHRAVALEGPMAVAAVEDPVAVAVVAAASVDRRQLWQD
jgi:hypothetical protein